MLAVGSSAGEEGQALLATARVRLRNHVGEVRTARTLLDPGSEVSLVTESLAQRLRLPRRRASVTVVGVGGGVSRFSKGGTTLELLTREGAVIRVPALILPRLSNYGESPSKGDPDGVQLQDLDLTDSEFSSSGSVEVLLGARTCASILWPGLRHAGGGELVAQETSLGWVVYGTMGTTVRRFDPPFIAELTMSSRPWWNGSGTSRRPLTPELHSRLRRSVARSSS